MKHDIPSAVLSPAGMRPAARTRWSAREAQARTVLAQRLRELPVDWQGRSWRVSLQPLLEVPPPEAGDWRIRLTWGGASYDLAWPASAVSAWVRARFPSVVVGELPDAFAALVLEAACSELMDGLARFGRGQARLEDLRRGPDAQPAAGAHALALEAVCGEERVCGCLLTGGLGLLLLAGLVADRAPVRNRLPVGELPRVLRLEIGRTRLAAAEFNALRPGDAVLVEHAFLSNDGQLWLGSAGQGLWVRSAGRDLVVTRAFETGGAIMSEPSLNDPGSPGPVDAGSVPLELAFDLGQRTMTLDELSVLQVGQVLPLERPPGDVVHLRVAGALVGTGELVEIDGRLGVVIASLAEAVPAPAAAVQAEGPTE